MEERIEEKDFEKKPKKGKILKILIIVVCIIILGIIGVFAWSKLNSKPEKIFSRVIDEIEELKERKGSKTEKINFELSATASSMNNDVTMLNTILSQIKLKATTEVDYEQKVLNQNFTVSVMGDDALNADAILQDNKMYFYLKDLYSKYIEIPTEEIEDFDYSSIFENVDLNSDSKLLEDIKTILKNKIAYKIYTQEKVSIEQSSTGDKKNVVKTSTQFSVNEIKEIIDQVINAYGKYADNTEISKAIENLDIDLDTTEQNENYAVVSIYTKGLKNEVVRADIEFVNVADDAIFALNFEKEDKNTTAVQVNLKEGIETGKFENIVKLYFTKENKNEGTIKVKVNVDGEATITLQIKYEFEENPKIEKRSITNAINVNDLTEEDQKEIYENVQNNPYLSGLMEMMMPKFALPEDNKDMDPLEYDDFDEDDSFDGDEFFNENGEIIDM